MVILVLEANTAMQSAGFTSMQTVWALIMFATASYWILIPCLSHHHKYIRINKHMVGLTRREVMRSTYVYIFTCICGDEKVMSNMCDEHEITTR